MSLAAFQAELREAQARYGPHLQWERDKAGKLRPVDLSKLPLKPSSTNVQKT